MAPAAASVVHARLTVDESARRLINDGRGVATPTSSPGSGGPSGDSSTGSVASRRSSAARSRHHFQATSATSSGRTNRSAWNVWLTTVMLDAEVLGEDVLGSGQEQHHVEGQHAATDRSAQRSVAWPVEELGAAAGHG